LVQSSFPFWGSAETYACPLAKSTPSPFLIKSPEQNELVDIARINDPHEIIKKSFDFPQAINRQLAAFV
jgi:hypothetical protein